MLLNMLFFLLGTAETNNIIYNLSDWFLQKTFGQEFNRSELASGKRIFLILSSAKPTNMNKKWEIGKKNNEDFYTKTLKNDKRKEKYRKTFSKFSQIYLNVFISSFSKILHVNH